MFLFAVEVDIVSESGNETGILSITDNPILQDTDLIHKIDNAIKHKTPKYIQYKDVKIRYKDDFEKYDVRFYSEEQYGYITSQLKILLLKHIDILKKYSLFQHDGKYAKVFLLSIETLRSLLYFWDLKFDGKDLSLSLVFASLLGYLDQISQEDVLKFLQELYENVHSASEQYKAFAESKDITIEEKYNQFNIKRMNNIKYFSENNSVQYIYNNHEYNACILCLLLLSKLNKDNAEIILEIVYKIEIMLKLSQYDKKKIDDSLKILSSSNNDNFEKIKTMIC